MSDENKLTFKEQMKACFLLIMAFVIIPPAILIGTFVLPFDYIKYKKSDYCKDTNRKYTFFAGNSHPVAFYKLIKRENLPVEYYLGENEGFFVCKDTLILNESSLLFYNEKMDQLQIEIDDEYVDYANYVQSDIDACNALIGSCICTKGVCIVHENQCIDLPKLCYENIELLPVKNVNRDDKIKALIKSL